MTVDRLYVIVYNFLYTHQIVAACIGVVLLIFLWKKPWEFLKWAGIAVGLLALFYVFTVMTESARIGTDIKHEITTEREEKLFGN